MTRRRVLVGAALVLLAPGRARARSSGVLPYPIAEVWPTAVRFLRVDRGYPVREKDEDAGYVLFDFVDKDKKHKGSLELIRTTDGDGRVATEVVFNVPDLPRHYEIMLVDKLSAKVRDERGAPAAPPPRKPPPESPARDAGALPRPPTLRDPR